MHIELSKQEIKELYALRTKLHAMGEAQSIRDMFERSEGFGDRVAVVEKIKKQPVAHTVREFHDLVKEVGTALYVLGLGGKHIAIVSENSYNWIVAFFAIVCGGGVAVPIDKELPVKDISALITKGDAEALFCSRTYFDVAEAHLNNDERCQKIFCMNGKSQGEKYITFEELAAIGRKALAEGDRSFLDYKVDPQSLAAVVFTSGTTGTNKGVMLTHFNFASNVEGIIEFIGPELSTMSILPMNHVYELSCSVLTAIYMNGIIYINDSLKNILTNINEFKPNAMAVVPLVLEAIYNGIWSTAEETGKAPILRKMVKISNKLLDIGIDIRPVVFKMIKEKFGGRFPTMSCGGAPARADHIKSLSEIGFRIIGGYGMTECAPTITLHDNGRKKPTAAGKAFPKAQYIIHDPDEEGIGEIWVKGDNVTKGYYKDEEATAASFEDGWFKTGDYGRVDEDGDLYITGRKKFLIILPNGENIFPETVESHVMESLLYAHEVVAFEQKVDINGRENVVMAVAVYVEKGEFPEGMTEEEIIAKVKADVYESNKGQPSYRKIQNVYVSFSEFEKNSTRKVIRQKVIDTYTK